MSRAAPQPIPYQGSKRRLVPLILPYFPADTAVLYEPFVGSGALSIGAAMAGAARRFVLGDTLAPLVGIWALLLEKPDELSERYARIWGGASGDSRRYYDVTRDTFNADGDPAKLLYLIARCVKNAVRFNAAGRFNQSPDLRRPGLHPDTLRDRATQVHALLAGRAMARCADYQLSLDEAEPEDLVYLDPPYMGVSGARDGRYHQGLDLPRFVADLDRANARGVSYLVSFDGRCGARSYGPPLPESLGLTRIELAAGRSSQATLSGRDEQTVESLYLSPALLARLGTAGTSATTSGT